MIKITVPGDQSSWRGWFCFHKNHIQPDDDRNQLRVPWRDYGQPSWSCTQQIGTQPLEAGPRQVWSLTQFYFAGYSQTRTIAKECVFTATNRVVLDCVLKLLRVSLSNCSSGSNTWGKVEDPWRVPCQLKKPFKGPRLSRLSCWEERKKIASSPMRGQWFLKKQME